MKVQPIMESKLSVVKFFSLFEKYCAKFLPAVYSHLVNNGFYVERRWKEKVGFEYLNDDHPDRRLFVSLVRSEKIKSVLEIGSGSQFELQMLKSSGDLSRTCYSVLDINQHWLTEGKKRTPEAFFYKGSINKIPFPSSRFNMVYCRHVIEHQPYFTAAIDEMWRVSMDWVVINCFRWSLTQDIIRRDKYFSNTYSIDNLKKYCSQLSEHVSMFVVLKEGRSSFQINTGNDGSNDVRRTEDHLLILMRKKDSISEEYLLGLQREAGATLIFRRF